MPEIDKAVADPAFADPRLAALYDVAEGTRPDLVHYAHIVDELDVGHILDVGCGTGTFACQLAERGLRVIGVDPAPASLAIAAGKPLGQAVVWIAGDATSLPPLAVDLAAMTGNVAQVFLTDDAWCATLQGIHAALRPGGHLVFEVRDPARKAWREWTKEHSHTTLILPGAGSVEIWVDLVEVALPFVSFRWTYRFDDGTDLYSHSTLRFRSRDEIEATLAEAGLVVNEVRDAPDRPGKEFVFIAQRLD